MCYFIALPFPSSHIAQEKVKNVPLLVFSHLILQFETLELLISGSHMVADQFEKVKWSVYDTF